MAHDILIVDDEADIRSLVSGILEDEGMASRQAANADEALAAVRARCPSLVILDIWLQGSRLDGLQILDELKRLHPEMPVVMISGHGNIETAVAAIKKGAHDFIEKPFRADRLILTVGKAVETARLKRENEELQIRAGGPAELLGASAAVQQLRQAVDRVAPMNSRVLVTGPAGSGKGMLARLIHGRSKRAEGPFVALNCAVLRPEHVEAALFGTETPSRGALGAHTVGIMEKAHGGTLFLDEVADMPPETQGKIVRVLQEQTFQRVGGSTKVQVDVRVIASTNRDLEAEMAAGRFGQDLYHRLNVVPLRVPSLAERREDIPALVSHFMALGAQASGLPPRFLRSDAMAVLQAYEWPGNARQLRNVVEWLLIMASGDAQEPVGADILPADISAIAPGVMTWDGGAEIMGLPLREAREMFEREYLLAQVTRFGGNISRTAAFVGMERSALHRKLKSLGVHGDADKQEAAG
ncbi:MAG: sigma-54 dependent transcriptional regulator [Pseudomonadota bacterium]|nr:sigma-54 dependent transcriptional regulator [Pseudomonadota bacterium]